MYKKAKTLIPGGTMLLSKRPEQLLPDRLQMTATPLEERLLKAARDLSESNLEVLIMVAERMK